MKYSFDYGLIPLEAGSFCMSTLIPGVLMLMEITVKLHSEDC